jgi:hypothetical protein
MGTTHTPEQLVEIEQRAEEAYAVSYKVGLQEGNGDVEIARKRALDIARIYVPNSVVSRIVQCLDGTAIYTCSNR